MRVFTWIVRSIVGVMVLICLIMISLAPQQVVTHFNGAGLADAFGPRWWLIVLPLLTVILAEFCIRTARQKRRKQGMLQVPTLTGFEGQCIAVLVSFNVMLWVMLQSEIQGLLVGGIMGLL
ncbi:membrane protein [Lactiplantibacillus plantarum EGD-AQ4]|nr:membrane protein [Lactiplantibacillus plantarum EGD-AQ4]